MAVVRVLVADDDTLFAEALVSRLEQEAGLEVLPVAQDAAQAHLILATGHPDVVVLDLFVGKAGGIDILDHIHAWHPYARPLILTAVAGIEPVVQAVRHGAVAWVPKTASGDLIVEIIGAVARGDAWFPPALLGEVLRRLAAERDAGLPPDPLGGLSPRERDVLQCMVDGLSRAETALRLGLSTNTVRTHVRRLLAKLDLHSALEAAATALRAGMRPSNL